MNGRKTVIVVVEGDIDVIYLRGPLEAALSALDLQPLFAVSGTDLTSDKGSAPDNIVQRVETEVWEAMDKVGLKVADIARIVQVTDLDGAYIPDTDIHVVSKKDPLSGVAYLPDGIYANQKSGIPERNARKASNMDVLRRQTTLLNGRIAYKLFYMSCNIEHALLGSCIPANNKAAMAKQKRREWIRNPGEFMQLLYAFDHGCQTWEDSWSYVEMGHNSLQRGTNLRFALPENW